MTKMVDISTGEYEQSFREEIVNLINKYANEHHLSMEQMLALSATVVGHLIFYQDQRTMTPTDAQELVTRNIELGNADAKKQMLETKGSA